MFSVLAPLYTSWSYTVISYIDYIRNRDEYLNSEYLPRAFDQLIQNVFVWLPVSIFLLLLSYPTDTLIKEWYMEIFAILFEFIFAEIWFYSLHRLCHHKIMYYLHKTHHEVKDSIGVLALYSSAFESTFVNTGNFYATHIMFNHSQFHIIVTITISLLNTILYSHTPKIRGQHAIHHRTHKYNFGHSLFMDKMFGTLLKPIKCN